MSGEFTTSETTWETWLRTATFGELADAEAQRANDAEGMGEGSVKVATLAKRAEILTEMDRREKAANATKNAMFPRIVFSQLEDAELIGEIVKRSAIATIEQLSELQTLKKMQRVARSLGLPVQVIVHGAGEGSDIDSIHKDHVTVLLRQAELLGAIGEQLEDLRRLSGGGSHDDRQSDLEVAEMAQVITTAISKFADKTGE